MTFLHFRRRQSLQRRFLAAKFRLLRPRCAPARASRRIMTRNGEGQGKRRRRCAKNLSSSQREGSAGGLIRLFSDT